MVAGIRGRKRERVAGIVREGNVAGKMRVSVDTWAVLLALAAAVLVRFGVIAKVPW